MSSPFLNPALPEPVAQPLDPTLDLIDRPALATAYLLAGALMEICGPLFWAVVVAGFLFAQFGLE
jgi:hypothetical protein